MPRAGPRPRSDLQLPHRKQADRHRRSAVDYRVPAGLLLLHPWLGIASSVAGIVLMTVTLLTERSSREPSRTVAQDAGTRLALVEAAWRNSETITAMGMESARPSPSPSSTSAISQPQGRASDVVYGSLSKALGLLMQSAILGPGAYLVIPGELTAGATIAASIMMGRALAPIEKLARLHRRARESERRLGSRVRKSSTCQRPHSQLRSRSNYKYEHAAMKGAICR
jgi:ATP-binding cassette subfamily C protein PrsD